MLYSPGKAPKAIKPFFVLGLWILCLALTRFAAARQEDRISLTVEPAGGLTFPVPIMDSRYYPSLGPDGQETLVTVTSGTSEPNRGTPDTWYIWIRAAAATATGPDPMPAGQLYWTVNQTGCENRLTHQWARIAVHNGTKHDPPFRDTVRIRLKFGKNDLYSAGDYHLVVEYSAGHDPYWP